MAATIIGDPVIFGVPESEIVEVEGVPETATVRIRCRPEEFVTAFVKYEHGTIERWCIAQKEDGTYTLRYLQGRNNRAAPVEVPPGVRRITRSKGHWKK